MEKLTQLLSGLGVNDAEQKLYILLFTKGALSASDIAKQAKLHRPRVYTLLASLRERGLVEVHLRGKRQEYVAVSPEKLKDIIAELARGAQELLPALSREYRKGKEKPAIVVYEGRAGVTQVFRDLVESSARGETFYRITSEKDLKHTNSYLPRDYRKIRDAKKLERFVISSPLIGRQKKARMERAMKFVPPGADQFEHNVVELIYADKVAFIDLSTETSFIVESPKLADFHKKLFRLLYQKL